MLLLSLATQKHTPKISNEIDTEYDYIIVGAGTAGSVIASRLSEMSCVKVLLLEAGGPPPLLTEIPAFSEYFRGTDIDWNFKTVPQKNVGDGLINKQLPYSSGKVLGGSSILNDMMYIRGNKKDYDQWEAEGAKGWSYKDLLPYFKKMEGNRDKNYIVNGFHAKDGPVSVHKPRYKSEWMDPLFKTIKAMGYKIVDPNGPKQTGFYDVQNTLRSGQRCSTAKAYLVPAENRTNLDILPYAMVKKILIKNNQAVGVQFDYENATYEVKSRREVILSAGAINTPQLLKLSGIGPRKELEKFNIPVVVDLPVGFNLQDHPIAFTNFLLERNIPTMDKKIGDPDNVLQYIQNRTGPLTSTGINAAAFLNSNTAVTKEDFPDFQLTFAESSSRFPTEARLTQKYQSQIYNPYKGRSFYTCFCSLLHPRSRGSVTLQSTNPYDTPLIDPNYLEDPKDILELVKGMKICLSIGKNPMMRSVGSIPFQTLVPGCENHTENENLYLECAVKSAILTFSHGVGTARMGDPEDPKTVVDPSLKVLKMKGLRVVDSSIMPNIPSGNPYIPSIMVAEKASDIIKSTIECLEEHKDLLTEQINPRRSGERLDNPMRPHSTQRNSNHKSYKEKTSSNLPTEPRYNPSISHSESYDIHEDENYEWGKKLHEHDLHWHLPKVTPWNKEIPNVIPWNEEIMQFNVFNPLTNQTLANNTNPLLSGNQQNVLPGAVNNFITSQLTNILNNLQQQTQNIPNIPQSQIQGITNFPQLQTPSIPNIVPPQMQRTVKPTQPEAVSDVGSSQLLSNLTKFTQPQQPISSNIPQLQSFFNVPMLQTVINSQKLQTLFNSPNLQSLLNKLQQQTSNSTKEVQAPNNLSQNNNFLQGKIPNHAGLPTRITVKPPLFSSNAHPVENSKIKYLDHFQVNKPDNGKLSPWQSVWNHGHTHNLPWNKEIPNLTPWNREIISFRSSIGNQLINQTTRPNAALPGITNTVQAPQNAINSQQPQGQPQISSASPQAPINAPTQTGNAQQIPVSIIQSLTQLQQTLEMQISLLTGRQQLMQSLLEIVQQMLTLLSSNPSMSSPSSRSATDSEFYQSQKYICSFLTEKMRCKDISCQNDKDLSTYMHKNFCT